MVKAIGLLTDISKLPSIILCPIVMWQNNVANNVTNNVAQNVAFEILYSIIVLLCPT